MKKKIKEVKQEVVKSQGYYDYEKIFMQLQTALNKCESQSELDSFEKLAEGFKKQDAPETLVDYLNISIKNKMITIAKRENIDLGKLRAISNQYK